jgi:hypothetical protein
MTTWSKDELISPFRDVRHPDLDLVGRVDDALYVRGYNGQNSRWYQAAVRQKAEVPWQPVPKSDDRHTRPLSDGQGHATRIREKVSNSDEPK